ncbi:MAG: phosphomannomutase/phosphoglucomutase [Chloroflexi bacterium]|uniref:phosphomannomutase/phosphoglucomutase n=1 Tax=Candidatus Flexifilum breve TaxID=3140694 RepID=UPI0031354822|nr:phosphomannomutase/phosphoglucomutase [Chloroflexota bacterium]
MAQVITTVFRKYDIRGTVTGANPQLTPELARYVGRALGTYLPQQFQTERVYVGQDNRLSSEPLRLAMIEGLLSTGLNVTDIGPVLTPTVYFASASHGDRGAGVMITGSHLSTDYNGIKMAYGSLALADQQILDLLKIIQTDGFATGQGELVRDYEMLHKHMETIKGKVKMARPLKVVLDAGNGLSGGAVPPILRDLGLDVTCLYCEPDGTYPNHLPNPEDPEMTKDLEAKVIEVGADLGLAFDGDSDRCGFIDNHGHHIAADRLLALLARDLLSRQPGVPIVFDVKASLALPDEIRKYGGVPVMWKTGHSLMKRKMREINSPLGGEVSGHLFVGENYFGFDDAPLVALKTLEIIARSGKTIGELFDEIPKLVATPEIILSAPDALKFQIIEETAAELAKDFEVVTLDGVRAIFSEGWGLVRASNTQPAITLRFEAYTAPKLVEYMLRFKDLLSKHPEVDLGKLQDQISAFSK